MSEMDDFPRIKRLPPYIFSITDALKKDARARGEDIIDFGMGNLFSVRHAFEHCGANVSVTSDLGKIN